MDTEQRTPVEEIVVGIFEEMLKLDRVGERTTSSNWEVIHY